MNATAPYPRLVIAGLSGDSGKTLVALGILLRLRDRGVEVRAFKKGPDYIDAAWLSWASGSPARNLDSYLMGFAGCRSSFVATAIPSGINVIEGNRGLYDGFDALGTHSTAELAKQLNAPVLIVLNARKTTRTAAACILGCQKIDPEVDICGIILNQVSGSRHERILRAAIESECGLPVLGALPRAGDDTLLAARHLGLVTPAEHPRIEELRNNVLQIVKNGLDLDAVCTGALRASALEGATPPPSQTTRRHAVRIGCLRDAALNFYYPENLEALERCGAEIVFISPLTAACLPESLDALYIGGGFPETHGAELAANRDFLAAVRAAAPAGMPVYAECGGLMLLSRTVRWRGDSYPMAAVFPWEVEVFPAPSGHGYVEMRVDRPNPFFAQGLVLRGHEFHYSRVISGSQPDHTVCAVIRGTGCGYGRDAWVRNNVWAAYTHLHALATPEWAEGLMTAAENYARRP